MGPGLRLVVDMARCDGHGICALRCPELVALDQWGYARVEAQAVFRRGAVRRARRAVAACPARALSLVAAPAPLPQPRLHLVDDRPGVLSGATPNGRPPMHNRGRAAR